MLIGGAGARVRRRCGAACAPWRGSVRAEVIGDCMSSCVANWAGVAGSIISACTGSIARKGRCVGANASGSPSRRAAFRRRSGSGEKPGRWTSCKTCSATSAVSRTLNVLDVAHPRVPGVGGRYLLARPARRARTRSTGRLPRHSQADHRRQRPRVRRAHLGRLGVRARRQCSISSKSRANRRKTATSRASTGSSATSALICIGSEARPMLARSSAAWKEEYTTQRPHSALRQQTPAAFAQSLAT